VKKGATLLLVLYGLTMLSYGALEMSHDFLHYLASHKHSHLHDHGHSHHHHFSDHHQHTHVHSGDHEEPLTETSAPIGFFLFVERQPAFVLKNVSFDLLKFSRAENLSAYAAAPETPPPTL